MKSLTLLVLAFCTLSQAVAQTSGSWESGWLLSPGQDDQIEVGGPLAGAEFHGSRPLPARISLYSPVANSIDLSTDYWRRGESQPILFGVSIDGSPLRWFGEVPWTYALAPHSVRFERKDGDLRYHVTYEFGRRDVAASMTVVILNEGSTAHNVTVSSRFALVLRSCQSYHRIAATRVRFDRTHDAAIGEFDDSRLARPAVFIQNVAAQPVSMVREDRSARPVDTLSTPAVVFTYTSEVSPKASLQIVQLIGSCRQNESAKVIARNTRGWTKDIGDLKEYVLNSQFGGGSFRSGDAWVDSAVSFSRALLAANQHYLDGSVVPMPCPAEYNFFFTHDVLLTDLSAITFDPMRVKRDLVYLFKHSKDGNLPHAYYWKDDGFKTEFCNAGNWNNLWIILAAASYYRHTFDEKTVLSLYPVLTRSLEKTLTMRKGNVLHGTEPDWWDFGNAPGARGYLTILTIRALEEYVYLSACLRKDLLRLGTFEQAAQDLRGGLISELWDDSARYLLNTTPAGRDHHFYMGALLATVFQVIPAPYARQMVETATSRLLDPAIGIRTVYPADFHTDSVKKFYGVKSNEAGDQFLYANGGVWYLGNAWYAWALRSIGEIEGSFDFFRRTMTLDGIMRSPRGQPALYEYRYADTTAGDHGRVDKPSMMWSAGFCIGTAYRLAGFQDNVWNVSVGGPAPRALQDVHAVYTIGKPKSVSRTGQGGMLTRLVIDGREIPSRVVPRESASGSTMNVEMGPIRFPFLDSVNAVLETAQLDVHTRTMRLALSSYAGHQTSAKIFTPWLPRTMTLNGLPWTGWRPMSTPNGTLFIMVDFTASASTDTIQINF
jgi:hypothetical protein